MKLRAWKVEIKTGKKGDFTVVKSIHDADEGTTFLDVVGFGLIGKALSANIKSGTTFQVSGNGKVSEFKKKDGTVGTQMTIYASEAKVALGDRIVTIDEFTTNPETPF